MNPMMTLNNAQNEFVKNLLSNLEKNHIPWRPTWDITITKPYNAVSNREYKGVNQLNLWMTSIQHGFADPRWLTFKQANEKGYRIKKGSVGTYVSNYGLRNIETKELIKQEDLSKLSPEELKKIKPFAKTYKVFNAKQIEGIPEIDLRSKEIAFENDKAEAFTNTLLKNIQLNVNHAGSEAFYTPSEDKIHIPPKSSFMDEPAFYATEMHEVAHATSHTTRLNREISTAFGSDKYAIEELRAELTSAFLTLDLGFHFDKFHEDNHTAYIQSWRNQIKDNPKVVFDSISDAQKIRQYMLDKGEYSEIYKQEKPTIERASLTEDGYIPGNLDNVIQNPIKKYPYTFKHILTEKETVILYKLGVPINVQCGFLDKNDNYYTNIQLNELTKKKSIDEDFAWQEENGIQFAGHKILKEEDLLILKDSYAHGYIDPSFISFDQMDSFIATFEYLTDSKYHILDENTCNSIQEKMIENAPLTLEKIVNYKNQYLNDDVIRAASTKNEWIIAAKHQNMNPLDTIKDNIIEDLTKTTVDTSAKLDINQSEPEHNDGTVLDSAHTPTADNKKTVVINLFAGPSAGKLYFLKDDFLEKYDLMLNKGARHSRPFFCCFADKKNKDIFWAAPLSTQVTKYQEIYDKNMIRYGRCDAVDFIYMFGKKNAVLLSSAFPVTNKHIKNKYINIRTGDDVVIGSKDSKRIANKMNNVIHLAIKGKNISFNNLFQMYQDAEAELELDKKKHEYFPTLNNQEIFVEDLEDLNITLNDEIGVKL